MSRWVLKEIRWDSMDWILLSHARDKCRSLDATVMSLLLPEDVGKLSGSVTGGF
jgi:hypothetical protein